MPDVAAKLSILFSVARDGLAARPRIALLVRAVAAIVATLLISGFLFVEAGKLWREWSLLQREVRAAHLHAPVGYVNIAPVASYAEAPGPWLRQDGSEVRLWSGWREGAGHEWFHFAKGDVDPARIVRAGRVFISRAVDYPLVEDANGAIWKRLPSESIVVGSTLEGQKCVYPLGILNKVEVINDVVEGHPYLILNPSVPQSDRYSIYDAALDGHRVTLAGTAYFLDGKPMFSDRGTGSLWSELEGSLRAVAGKYRGRRLGRVAHPDPETWGSWLGRNGQGRLLVGADRTPGIPTE
jgi:hypothetical protein